MNGAPLGVIAYLIDAEDPHSVVLSIYRAIFREALLESAYALSKEVDDYEIFAIHNQATAFRLTLSTRTRAGVPVRFFYVVYSRSGYSNQEERHSAEDYFSGLCRWIDGVANEFFELEHERYNSHSRGEHRTRFSRGSRL